MVGSLTPAAWTQAKPHTAPRPHPAGTVRVLISPTRPLEMPLRQGWAGDTQMNVGHRTVSQSEDVLQRQERWVTGASLDEEAHFA